MGERYIKIHDLRNSKSACAVSIIKRYNLAKKHTRKDQRNSAKLRDESTNRGIECYNNKIEKKIDPDSKKTERGPKINFSRSRPVKGIINVQHSPKYKLKDKKVGKSDTELECTHDTYFYQPKLQFQVIGDHKFKSIDKYVSKRATKEAQRNVELKIAASKDNKYQTKFFDILNCFNRESKDVWENNKCRSKNEHVKSTDKSRKMSKHPGDTTTQRSVHSKVKHVGRNDSIICLKDICITGKTLQLWKKVKNSFSSSQHHIKPESLSVEPQAIGKNDMEHRKSTKEKLINSSGPAKLSKGTKVEYKFTKRNLTKTPGQLKDTKRKSKVKGHTKNTKFRLRSDDSQRNIKHDSRDEGAYVSERNAHRADELIESTNYDDEHQNKYNTDQNDFSSSHQNNKKYNPKVKCECIFDSINDENTSDDLPKNTKLNSHVICECPANINHRVICECNTEYLRNKEPALIKNTSSSKYNVCSKCIDKVTYTVNNWLHNMKLKFKTSKKKNPPNLKYIKKNLTTINKNHEKFQSAVRKEHNELESTKWLKGQQRASKHNYNNGEKNVPRSNKFKSEKGITQDKDRRKVEQNSNKSERMKRDYDVKENVDRNSQNAKNKEEIKGARRTKPKRKQSADLNALESDKRRVGTKPAFKYKDKYNNEQNVPRSTNLVSTERDTRLKHARSGNKNASKLTKDKAENESKSAETKHNQLKAANLLPTKKYKSSIIWKCTEQLVYGFANFLKNTKPESKVLLCKLCTEKNALIFSKLLKNMKPGEFKTKENVSKSNPMIQCSCFTEVNALKGWLKKKDSSCPCCPVPNSSKSAKSLKTALKRTVQSSCLAKQTSSKGWLKKAHSISCACCPRQAKPPKKTKSKQFTTCSVKQNTLKGYSSSCPCCFSKVKSSKNAKPKQVQCMCLDKHKKSKRWLKKSHSSSCPCPRQEKSLKNMKSKKVQCTCFAGQNTSKVHSRICPCNATQNKCKSAKSSKDSNLCACRTCSAKTKCIGFINLLKKRKSHTSSKHDPLACKSKMCRNGACKNKKKIDRLKLLTDGRNRKKQKIKVMICKPVISRQYICVRKNKSCNTKVIKNVKIKCVKKRKKPHVGRRRRRFARNKCAQLYLFTMRNPPCVCLYKLCPSLYPCIMGIMSSSKRLLHAFLFTMACIVWCPCIIATELCRIMVPCLLCAC